MKEKKQKESKSLSLTEYMLRVIDELIAEERFGTAHVYQYALRAFMEFVGGGEIFFGGLSRRSLKLFENYLRIKLCSWNTVSTYTRSLRAVYNRAVDAEIIAGEFRLFSGVFTGVKSEQKRALEAKQMNRLLDADAFVARTSPDARTSKDASTSQTEQHIPASVLQSRDLLFLMLHLQGMPYVDLLHLHRDDLHADASGYTILQYRRQKTDTELTVTVTAEAMKLINRYRSTDPNSPYLLRFFDGLMSGESIYRKYCRQLRLLNYGHSKLSGYCGLEGVKVSFYTARHTWATLAKYCQVPEEVISEGLGHSSLEVTRTYLKSFEKGELEKVNRIIIDYIYTGKKTVWSRA